MGTPLATLMLEGAADIRFIQQMLGHADISAYGSSARSTPPPTSATSNQPRRERAAPNT